MRHGTEFDPEWLFLALLAVLVVPSAEDAASS